MSEPNTPASFAQLVANPAAHRSQLRQQCIAAREALPAAQHAEWSAQLAQHMLALLQHLGAQQSFSVLGLTWPYRAEFDARALAAQWCEQHPSCCMALPVVVAEQHPLQWRAWRPNDEMRQDRYGIPVPNNETVLQPDLLIVPCNAFDARGYRLGYGAGYFDRSLAAMQPAPLTIGTAFEFARQAHLPINEHDRPLDWMVTERGYFKAHP